MIYKSVYILKVYSIHYTLRQNKNVKKTSFGKNVTKNALFVLSRAPFHHTFTFDSRFLYELEHKIWFSKSVCGIFYFRFRFVFISLLFLQKAWILRLQNVIIPLKIKITEKPQIILLPYFWFLNYNKKFLNLISA